LSRLAAGAVSPARTLHTWWLVRTTNATSPRRPFAHFWAAATSGRQPGGSAAGAAGAAHAATVRAASAAAGPHRVGVRRRATR
jgi:hypothetical protein